MNEARRPLPLQYRGARRDTFGGIDDAQRGLGERTRWERGVLGRSLFRNASVPEGEAKGRSRDKQQGGGPCIAATAPPPTLPPTCLPPFSNAGPAVHPPLPSTPPTGYFGHPANVTSTSGCQLSPAEVALRQRWLATALTAAQGQRPISVRFLRHYIGGTGNILPMQPSSFTLQPSSRFGEFLLNTARPAFRQGVERRLRNPQDPQGTLRTGQPRFLQYRDGIRPPTTGGVHGPQSIGADMATSLGAYYIHSALWARAQHNSGTRWTVDILAWYAQVYDWYNWNHGQDANIAVPHSTTIPRPPWPEVTIRSYGVFQVITIPDDWFRDLEVSGGARSYLVYTVPFQVPAQYRQPFSVSVP